MKTFQKDGKWVNKPFRTEILVCACGSKYIKTRLGQTGCIRCANRNTRPQAAPEMK